MDKSQDYPDINQLSIIAAIILLAYAITPLVSLPDFGTSFDLFGVNFVFNLNFNTLVSILVPAYAAAGTFWLLGSHPHKSVERFLFHHCILPALTAWVIGVPLSRLPIGPQWWAVFALGGMLLIIVLAAEYAVVDINSERHALAAGGLKALSFALYFFLVIALRAAGLRLYLFLPALMVTTLLVLSRTFYLHLSGKWKYGWTAGITTVVAQIAVGLHYFPLDPLSYGFLLLAPAYTLTDIAIGIENGLQWRRILIGPLMMLILFFILAFIF